MRKPFFSKTEKKYLGLMTVATTIMAITGISYILMSIASVVISIVGAFKENNIALNATSISWALVLMRLGMAIMLSSEYGVPMGLTVYGDLETYIDILSVMPWDTVVTKARTLVRK